MSLLSQDEILGLHAASVSGGLLDKRAALLAGIAPSFAGTLEHAQSPGEQILLDLYAMSRAGELTDGSLPLAAWLENALVLLGDRREALVFRAALARAGDAEPDRPDGRRDLSSPLAVRLYNVAASCEWRVEQPPDTTVLQLIGWLRDRIQAQKWTRRDVPKPGAAYQFRLYRSEKDDQPLSPHLTLGALLGGSRGRSVALNIEWSRVFRGAMEKKFR